MTTVSDTRPLRHWLHGAGGPHLVICCVEHRDPGAWSRAVARPGSAHAVIQLATCAADVPPAVLLELVAAGASGITVALDGCADPDGAQSVMAQAGLFLSALRRPQSIEGALDLAPEHKHGGSWPILGVNDVPMSRRALLGRPDGLALAEPSRHPTERLVAVLRELAGGQASWTELDGIPTGTPRLTAAGCAGSGACARTCPVNALTLTRTVLAEANPDRDAIAQFHLMLAAGRCTDCGQCLQACPESALERSGQYLWSSLLAGEPVSLKGGLTRRCLRCGGGHGGPGELCAVCAFRTANPFGSAMPPGRPALVADPSLVGQPSCQ
jgi:ferredoxin